MLDIAILPWKIFSWPHFEAFKRAGHCIWCNTGRHMSAHLHLETQWTLWPYWVCGGSLWIATDTAYLSEAYRQTCRKWWGCVIMTEGQDSLAKELTVKLCWEWSNNIISVLESNWLYVICSYFFFINYMITYYLHNGNKLFLIYAFHQHTNPSLGNPNVT